MDTHVGTSNGHAHTCTQRYTRPTTHICTHTYTSMHMHACAHVTYAHPRRICTPMHMHPWVHEVKLEGLHRVCPGGLALRLHRIHSCRGSENCPWPLPSSLRVLLHPVPFPAVAGAPQSPWLSVLCFPGPGGGAASVSRCESFTTELNVSMCRKW